MKPHDYEDGKYRHQLGSSRHFRNLREQKLMVIPALCASFSSASYQGYHRATNKQTIYSTSCAKERHRVWTACASSPAKKSESVAAGMSQQDMYQTTMLDQLDEPLHSPETVVDTATTATIIVPATLLSAMSTARVSLQSATLVATSGWSSDDSITG